MADGKNQKRDWVELLLKAMMPVIVALLIAWAGFIGDRVLTAISSKQESARLITELQIKREQAEMIMRKDVFDKALEALLLKKQDNGGTLKDMSKQLLRLELLALNFGDSLSLSPLFAETRKDLDRSKPAKDEDRRDYGERRAELRKRLEALAKRVASSQVSSLAQHGKIKSIRIPLFEYEDGDSCKKILFQDKNYNWPNDTILEQLGYDDIQKIKDSEEDLKIFQESTKDKSLIELNGVERFLQLYISDVDFCKKTAKTQIILKKDDSADPEVDRSFKLDYYNFPMVDNTRLSKNHRLAIIMDVFELTGNDPHIEIVGIIFPSEYASLRDRPGMQEARKLLESALEN